MNKIWVCLIVLSLIPRQWISWTVSRFNRSVWCRIPGAPIHWWGSISKKLLEYRQGLICHHNLLCLCRCRVALLEKEELMTEFGWSKVIFLCRWQQSNFSVERLFCLWGTLLAQLFPNFISSRQCLTRSKSRENSTHKYFRDSLRVKLP